MDTRNTETLSSSTFTIAGVRHEITTFRGGRTEIYVEYADEPGLMEFRGYYDELVHTDHRLVERIFPSLQAHLQAHKAFWATYLPGAECWLRAA